MVSFVELFNTTVEKVKEVLPKLTDSMKELCPAFYKGIKEDVDNKLIKSCTISKMKPGTKINKIDTYPFRVGLSKPMVMGVSATASFKRSDFGMNYALKKNVLLN